MAIRGHGLGICAAALCLAAPALASPGDMAVSVFLAKAEALKAKGMAAMFSSEIGVLMAEGKAAGQAYREQLALETRAGRPSSCPPPKAPITSDILIEHLKSYPVAVRPNTSIRTAMADLFRKKYPCSAKGQ